MNDKTNLYKDTLHALKQQSAEAKSRIQKRMEKGLSASTPPESSLSNKAIRPNRPNPVAYFTQQATALDCTVQVVPTQMDIPQAVLSYLNQRAFQPKHLPHEVVAAPETAVWPWQPLIESQQIKVAFRMACEQDTVGITSSFCGIVDTGTMMLRSSLDCPSSISLLPETHIVAVDINRLAKDMEAAWALLKQDASQNDGVYFMPRAINFISGPSRTGDIEQTIVLGAHGPCHLHVILYSKD